MGRGNHVRAGTRRGCGGYLKLLQLFHSLLHDLGDGVLQLRAIKLHGSAGLHVGCYCWLGGSRDKDLSVAELRASPRRPKVLDEGRLRGPQACAGRLFTPSRCLPRGGLPRHELSVGRTAPHPPDPDWCAIAQSNGHVIGRDAGIGDVVIWRMLSQRALLLPPIEPMWGFAVKTC